MKEGDKVICINDIGYTNYITSGKEYYVCTYINSFRSEVEILTNGCSRMWFFQNRFVSIYDYRRL